MRNIMSNRGQAMSRRTKAAVAVASASTLLVASLAVGASAYASDSAKAPPNTQPAASASSSQSIGPAAKVGARRYAVVSDTGVLVRALNAFGAHQVSGGTYEVDFDRDVTGCAFIATIGTTAAGSAVPGMITVAQRAGVPNGVWVDTSNADGTDGTRAFHLEVIC